MGAWGAGSFDNDDALDWVGDLCDGDGFEPVHEALGAVALDAEEDVEAPECSVALAAAEAVAALGGAPSEDLPDELEQWLADHPLEVGADLRAKALAAVQHVKSNSELKELWDESDSAE